MNFEAKAYAKINLHLEVLNKRQDGYHNIFSLMAESGIFDLLKLKEIDLRDDPGGDTDVLILSEGGACPDILQNLPVQDNLVFKAVHAYCRRTGKSGRVVVSLQKNIPAGAGLGGGSSDAAAILRLLNESLAAISTRELSELGAAIGADVPFCLAGGCAFCEGIGEIVEPVESNLHPAVLIALCGIPVSTAMAYKALERSESDHPAGEWLIDRKKTLRTVMQSGDARELSGKLINDFEVPVFRMFPEVERVKSMLLKEGADFAIMTGSGSGVVGLFNEERKALVIAERIKSEIPLVLKTTI